MVGHGRAPGVEHGGDAEPRPQVFGIGSGDEHRLGARFEQQVVDHAFVLVGDIGYRRRHRVDDMEVANGQQLGLARG